MAKLIYLTHPQVQIDPETPVTDWQLNAIGSARIDALAKSGVLKDIYRIISSAERKATETAVILGNALGIQVEIRADSGENDRSATGFLPGNEFEAAADTFFAVPDCSFRGWETARAAQSRIVTVYSELAALPGNTLMVGHGAVGTLLLCQLGGWHIDRKHDQPAGGGNVFTYMQESKKLLHGWQAIEEII